MERRLVNGAILLVLTALLAACGSSGGSAGYTPVTVTVGGAKGAARAPKALRKAMPAVATITFTVSGPDMTTETRTVAVTPPQTVTEVFYIMNGPQRTFTIAAADSGGTTLFQGSAIADLGGTPVSLPITLQATSSVFPLMVGTDRTDEATAMVRDGNGNLIVAGHTSGDLGGPNADASRATTDIFVTKMTYTNGGFVSLWSGPTRTGGIVQTGTAGMDICYSAATDSAGNIYLAGSTAGNLSGEVLSGISDAFVMKLDPSGNLLWTRLTGTAGAATFGNAVAVDIAGNVYLAGDTTGGLNGANRGLYDFFLAKLDTNGILQWVRQTGTSGDDFGEAVAVEAGGQWATITGSTDGNLFAQNAGPGFSDIVIARYDAAGNPGWNVQFGTADDDAARAVTVDASANVYLAGETWGDLDGTGTGTYGGLADAFLASYDGGAGTQRWVRQLGGAGNDAANAVSVEQVTGEIFFTGQISMLSSATGYDADIFVAKHAAADGAGRWTAPAPFGTAAADEGRGVVAQGGTVFVAGNSSGGYTPSISKDIVLLLFSSASGTKL